MEDDWQADWQNVSVALGRFGLPARPWDREAIIAALKDQIALERREEGDQHLMRLLGAQLFSIGRVEDSRTIWAAKSCNFDTHCGIDVQLLCGAGLLATKAYLAATHGEDAHEALDYLIKSEASGDFANFSPQRTIEELRAFYGETPGEEQ